jgi:hypothetical protein
MKKMIIAHTLKTTSKFIVLSGLSLCITENLFARGFETEDFGTQARSVIFSSVSDDMDVEAENTKKPGEDNKLRVDFQKALELAKQEQNDNEEEEDSSKTLNEGSTTGKKETKKLTRFFFENLGSPDTKEAKEALEKTRNAAVLSMISASDGGASFTQLDTSNLPETVVDRVFNQVVGFFQ